jgi:photosystem II stability/assembly factor-like uncharacterized protein
MKRFHTIAGSIAALLFLSASLIFSQSWTPLNGPSKAKNIKDIVTSGNGATLFSADESFVFKSTDNGANWVATSENLASPLVITAKPGSMSYVVAARSSDLRFSSDGGVTWNVATPSNYRTPLRLATSYANEDVMYLGVEGVSGQSSLIRKPSGDNGWYAVTSFNYITDLSDVWLSASTTNDLWLCGGDPDGAGEGTNPDKSNGNPSTDKRGVWNSQDGGSTWNAKLLGDHNIRTLTVNGQEIYAGTYSGKIFYSANGGGHWVQRTSPSGVTSVRAIRLKGSGDLIIASNNGVFTSADDGANWTARSLPDANDKDVLSLTVAKDDPSLVYVGTTKSVYKSTNGGTDWSTVDNGLGRMPITGVCAYDGNVWTSSSDYPLIGAYDGSSWSNKSTSSNFLGKSVSRHANGNIYVSGSDNGKSMLLRSTNAGSEFSQYVWSSGTQESNVFMGTGYDPRNTERNFVFGLEDDTHNYRILESQMGTVSPIDRINVMAFNPNIPDGSNSKYIFVGTESHGVYRSTTSGGGWAATGVSGTAIRSISLSTASPSSDTVWVAGPGGIWWSRFRGDDYTWSQRYSDPVNQVIMNPLFTSACQIFILADNGNEIYRCDNAGSSSWTWTDLNASGQLPTPISYVTAPKNEGFLYAATQLGVYRLDLEPMSPKNVQGANADGHPRISWNANGEVDLNSSGKYQVYKAYKGCWFQGSKIFCSANWGDWNTIGSPTNSTSFTDYSEDIIVPLPGGTEFYKVGYRVQARDAEDPTVLTSALSESIAEFLADNGTETEKAGRGSSPDEQAAYTDAPDVFSLRGNFPNPFNPSTEIRYGLARDTHVRVNVYDMLGREVAHLVDEFQTAGYKSVRFDGSNLPSGIYLCRIMAGKFVDMKKMMLAK